jgi:hypothetical protein
MQQYAAAIKDFDEAVRLDPNFLPARKMRQLAMERMQSENKR